MLGWAGRLTAIKRPLDLIRVAAGIDGAVLVLVGDGEYRDTAEDDRRGSSASPIAFASSAIATDLASLYPAFDVFLLIPARFRAALRALRDAQLPRRAPTRSGT